VSGFDGPGSPGRPGNLAGPLRHEAFLYADDDEYLRTLTPFFLEGLDAGEVLVALTTAERWSLLRDALGAAAERVAWVDMTELGRNPTRLIAAWHQFIDANLPPGRRLRGIGQPVWPGRSAAELVECHHHEVLANVSFADVPAWVMCPYDTSALDPAVVEDARLSHPLVATAAGDRSNGARLGEAETRATLTGSLTGSPTGSLAGSPTEPPVDVEMDIYRGRLRELRRAVAGYAIDAGLAPGRVDDLVLAVDEVATNSLIHGGGRGVLRAWTDGDSVVHEVRDRGQIDEPLVGRRRPAPDQTAGRGLWVVNELCDLVQIRSSAAGTVVRMHMHRR
jgi:anti-sigma regulatory factor (Ser/Thr protein kinase)